MKFRKSSVSRSVVFGLTAVIAVGSWQCHPASPARAAQSTEANITELTTSLLERSQFGHHAFDAALAGTLVERYLDALDGTRSLFLQSDVDELAANRATLAHALRADGDTNVARAIFQRYLTRLAQRNAFFDATLETAATFDFTGHDVYAFDRRHAERPRDLAAAEALWKQQLRAEVLQEKLTNEPADRIVATLARRHAHQLRTMSALRTDEVLEIYLNALAHVYDPHSDYLGHEQLESFAIAMDLSLVGIGATLDGTDGQCKVHELVPGGPAARSGMLKVGDRIVAVAQEGHAPIDVDDMPLSRAVELIRGPRGSKVTLTIVAAADGARKAVTIVRDQVELADEEAHAKTVELPTGDKTTMRLGVIDLPSFYSNLGMGADAPRRSATVDVARLLAELATEHVQGIVLDLRHNGGGSLEEAISLAGLFIRRGPIVQTRDASGDVEIGADRDGRVSYDGPLVVLTSRGTASASEIVAGALQDYGRALIVGDTSTFGKGTVQNIVPLGRLMDKAHLAHAYDPGALKITISKFYRPSGASTQLRGVASDIVIPSPSDASDVGESHLPDPLPWDVLPSTRYEHLDRVSPYVDALRKNAARRIASDDRFARVEDDIARMKRAMSSGSISLNEAERRAVIARDKSESDRGRDLTLDETLRILADYVDLVRGHGAA
jgi:carboxyl-terminal processing protease